MTTISDLEQQVQSTESECEKLREVLRRKDALKDADAYMRAMLVATKARVELEMQMRREQRARRADERRASRKRPARLMDAPA